MFTSCDASPVLNATPVAAWNCAAVIRKVAAREEPLVATPLPGWTLGWERKMALTRTSTLGTV